MLVTVLAATQTGVEPVCSGPKSLAEAKLLASHSEREEVAINWEI